MCPWATIYDDEVPLEERGFEPIGKAIIRVVDKLVLAHELSRVTESPIETVLGVSLTHAAQLDARLIIIPQFKWRRYRIDWAVQLAGEELPKLFIECDGKDFHSTPEQVARDQRRDEEARQAGFIVIRFSGVDIYRNADACVRLALSELWAKHQP